jgi:hypothetical protein
MVDNGAGWSLSCALLWFLKEDARDSNHFLCMAILWDVGSIYGRVVAAPVDNLQAY